MCCNGTRFQLGPDSQTGSDAAQWHSGDRNHGRSDPEERQKAAQEQAETPVVQEKAIVEKSQSQN